MTVTTLKLFERYLFVFLGFTFLFSFVSIPYLGNLFPISLISVSIFLLIFKKVDYKYVLFWIFGTFFIVFFKYLFLGQGLEKIISNQIILMGLFFFVYVGSLNPSNKHLYKNMAIGFSGAIFYFLFISWFSVILSLPFGNENKYNFFNYFYEYVEPKQVGSLAILSAYLNIFCLQCKKFSLKTFILFATVIYSSSTSSIVALFIIFLVAIMSSKYANYYKKIFTTILFFIVCFVMIYFNIFPTEQMENKLSNFLYYLPLDGIIVTAMIECNCSVIGFGYNPISFIFVSQGSFSDTISNYLNLAIFSGQNEATAISYSPSTLLIKMISYDGAFSLLLFAFLHLRFRRSYSASGLTGKLAIYLPLLLPISYPAVMIMLLHDLKFKRK